MALLSFAEIKAAAKRRRPVSVAVAAAADRGVLEAVSDAARQGYCRPTLFGPRDEVEALLGSIEEQSSLPTGGELRVVDCKDAVEASEGAVRAVYRGEADVLMKGVVETSVILKAVLDEGEGLRGPGLLSHVALFEIAGFPRILAVTDAAMNIEPDLDRKRASLENGVGLLHALGLEEPKVAIICAKEKVSDKMPCTKDAAALAELQAAGEIEGCLVAGPYALDNAVSPEAAAHKGIEGAVAGRADLLLVPDIEAGNILYKSLAFLAEARVAGLIVGASAPIVLTSRADSVETRSNSLALAVRFAQG